MAPLIESLDADQTLIGATYGALGSGLSLIPPKWSCPKCTYLNYPKSTRCVQCNAAYQTGARKKNYPGHSASGKKSSPARSITPTSHHTNTHKNNLHNSRENLNNNNTLSELVVMGGAQKESDGIPLIATNDTQLLSQPTAIQNDINNRLPSSKGPTIGQAANNDSFKSVGEALQKWSCSVCTYENWPKSQRCTICEEPRPLLASACASSSRNYTTASLSSSNSCLAGASGMSSHSRDSPPPVATVSRSKSLSSSPSSPKLTPLGMDIMSMAPAAVTVSPTSTVASSIPTNTSKSPFHLQHLSQDLGCDDSNINSNKPQSTVQAAAGAAAVDNNNKASSDLITIISCQNFEQQHNQHQQGYTDSDEDDYES